MTARSYTGIGTAPAAGGGAAPDLITLGTWGTASVISGGSQHQPPGSLLPANYFRGTCTIQLDATTIARLYRVVSTNVPTLMVATLSGGSISTATFTSLASDLGSYAGPMIMRKVSASRIIISAPTVSSPHTHKYAVYDIASETPTLHGSVQTLAATNDAAYNAVHGNDLVVCDSDYAILFAKDGAAARQTAIPIKFTTTQSWGTPVVGSNTLLGTNYNVNPSFLSTITDNRVWGHGETVLLRWDLTEGSPPSVAKTVVGSLGTSASNATSWTIMQPGGLILPPTDLDDGSCARYGPINVQASSEEYLVHFKNGTTDEYFYSGGLQTNVRTLAGNKFDAGFVQVDTSGDWVRGVAIQADGTTGLEAFPLNINVVDGGYKVGTRSATTNLTPHTTAGIGLEGLYQSSAGHILMIGEDTAGSPSSITLSVTT